MREINFSNRSWQSFSDAYLNLKSRYRFVKFSSYKKYNVC